ncbi:unnamed protein product, partial [Sphenostylis stenocarpa]
DSFSIRLDGSEKKNSGVTSKSEISQHFLLFENSRNATNAIFQVGPIRTKHMK